MVDTEAKEWVVCVRSAEGIEACVRRDGFGLVVPTDDDGADRMTVGDANTLVVTLRTTYRIQTWYRHQPRKVAA